MCQDAARRFHTLAARALFSAGYRTPLCVAHRQKGRGGRLRIA